MSTSTLPSITEASTIESDLDHFYCPDCHPDGDRAFCGTDVSDDEVVLDSEISCVVCRDLDTCPECDYMDVTR